MAGTVEARDDRGQSVGQAPTDSDGSFVLPLPAGMYTLHVLHDGLYPRCPDTPVTIKDGEQTHVDISCDTGMR